MQIDQSIELYVFSLSQTCLATGSFYCPRKHSIMRGAQILRSSLWNMRLQAVSLPFYSSSNRSSNNLEGDFSFHLSHEMAEGKTDPYLSHL